jgi:hypothetical protein
MIALRKMKKKSYLVDKNKFKEDRGILDPVKYSHEARMDEMSRLIRNLTKKNSRFEMENSKSNKSPQESGVRNPKHFMRPVNP